MLIEATKEIRLNFLEGKTLVDTFVKTLASQEEEQKLQQVPLSNLERILSQNDFRVEVTAQSKPVNLFRTTLIDLKTTNMFISDLGKDKFEIRNR